VCGQSFKALNSAHRKTRGALTKLSKSWGRAHVEHHFFNRHTWMKSILICLLVTPSQYRQLASIVLNIIHLASVGTFAVLVGVFTSEIAAGIKTMRQGERRKRTLVLK